MNSPTNLQLARADYYERLRPEGLAPLWSVLSALVTPTPRTPAVGAAWSFDRIQPLLMEAGELITAEEAERRVLILENPALPGESRITGTLYAGLQLILPGEVAPAHRHTQNALRFVLSGEGAFTAIDGVRAYMHQYDLILTPAWTWHDHGNETDGPMIWLDGLDIPLVQMLDASFSQHREDRGAMPTMESGQGSPTFIYPYAEWRAGLEALRDGGPPDAHDAYLSQFTSPADGGPVMATISAFARLIPAGFATEPKRSSDGMINVVVMGTGTLIIDGDPFALTPGEIVVVPSWSERCFHADNDLILFSYSDRATQEKLGLWRESSVLGNEQ